jgi:2-oxoisovalerate dehydrogenase E1 component
VVVEEVHNISIGEIFTPIGDGTLGQGVVYESLNMASLWHTPILYIVENNHIAQTTPVELALAGSIPDRFNSFGIPGNTLDSSDVLEIKQAAEGLVEDIRLVGGPRFLLINTYRFGPHSKGDDTRDRDTVASFKESRDPLKIHASRIDTRERSIIENQVDAEVEAAFQLALKDPFPELNDWKTINPPRTNTRNGSPVTPDLSSSQAMTVLQSLNRALFFALQSDERVILMGEDILDPYGGAFKVTRGLSSTFPERVIPTPISEAGIVGIAAGMALGGLRPVVEIMFGDFITLIADQVVNHLTKFRWMYNDQVRVPVVIRTPMGARRGYGPTHSQTLEKLFLGVPGLKVVAPCDLGFPGQLLFDAIIDDDPVLFIENKLLYLSQVQEGIANSEFLFSLLPSSNHTPAYALSLKGAPKPVLTLVAYGYMAILARQAVLELAYQDEIFVELIVLTQLSPPWLDPVLASTRKTGRVLVVEEGNLSFGWGAEVIAQVSEELGGRLIAARRVAAWDSPVPSSSVLEKIVLPDIDDIISTAQNMVIR